MVKTTHLAYRVNSQTLTEYILIRETLWFDGFITFDWCLFFILFSRLLMNLSQLHVYVIDDKNQTHVADFVRLCDITPVLMQKIF
jgi:hypothetical protein